MKKTLIIILLLVGMLLTVSSASSNAKVTKEDVVKTKIKNQSTVLEDVDSQLKDNFKHRYIEIIKE